MAQFSSLKIGSLNKSKWESKVMLKQVNNEMLKQVQHDKKVNHHSELVSGISSFCHPELVSGSKKDD